MKERLHELSEYRLSKASDDLKSARLLFENKQFAQSINRSYYAVFHSVRSLLIFDSFDSSKHSGIISFFNKNYIKINEIEKEYSKIITSAYRLRTNSDYNDFFVASKDDASQQINDADQFILRIKKYIEENFINNRKV